jgi:hypothetical protein
MPEPSTSILHGAAYARARREVADFVFPVTSAVSIGDFQELERKDR